MYTVEVRPAALRALERIPRKDLERIRGAIALLAREPRPPGARKLRERDAYRVRVGDYRVIYTADDGRLVVTVIRLGHRKHVYR